MTGASSAGFDGKEFYFEEMGGERRILLNAAEVVMRDGIASMPCMAGRVRFPERREAFLSVLMERLQALGGGEAGLEASLVLLLSLEAMSWESRPYRAVKAGGRDGDLLSKGLGAALGMIHPGSVLHVPGRKEMLPEEYFDLAVVDHAGGCPDSLVAAAKRSLRPGGRLFCVSQGDHGERLFRVPKGEMEPFPIAKKRRLLLWDRTPEDCRETFRRNFPGLEAPRGEMAFRKRKTVVFLPFRVAFWDSMESIWRAASEDRERCVPYVVPIPYADLDREEKAGTWHDEGWKFPEEVPVIPPDSLDISRLKPDIIYINHHFEDGSHVVAVEERFLARNLRPYAGKIVYVPYFTTGRRWPESHLYAPCYPFVDRIVIQRPRMEVAQMGLEGAPMKAGDAWSVEDWIPREKLLPLGSPKIDRLFWCEAHREVPGAWEDRIRGRKVVLYNTSVSSLCKYGSRFLRKMAYVFRAFEGREDVVLLWRPHPFLRNAAKFCGEELSEAYLALRARFLEEDMGILDETPDAAMAIAAADAYVGESSSSMVSMFGFVGKPIFLTSMVRLWQRPNEEEIATVRLGGGFFRGNTCYFLSNDFHALCRMDMERREVLPVLAFGDGPNGETYGGPWREGDLLYFSPNTAKDLLLFDLGQGKTKRIPLKHPRKKGNLGGMFPHGEYLYFLPNGYPAMVRIHRKSHVPEYFPLDDLLPAGNFGGVVPYGEFLYFLPSRYPSLVRMDTRTGEMTYDGACLKRLHETRTSRQGNVMAGRCVRKGRQLLLASRLTNLVLELDMETGAWRYHEVGPEDADSNVMLKESEDVYWIFPWRTRKIRRWNFATGECGVVDEYPEGYACEKDWEDDETTYPFAYVRRVGDEVWLYPSHGNMMLRLDMKARKLVKWDVELPPHGGKEGTAFSHQSMFLGMLDWNGELWAQRSYDRKFLVIDKETRVSRLEPAIRMSMEVARSLMAPVKDSFGPVNDDVPYAVQEDMLGRSVGAFLDYVVREEHDREAQKVKFSVLADHSDGTCGRAVHGSMMDLLEEGGRNAGIS